MTQRDPSILCVTRIRSRIAELEAAVTDLEKENRAIDSIDYSIVSGVIMLLGERMDSTETRDSERNYTSYSCILREIYYDQLFYS